MIDESVVRHVAKLARVKLSDEEVQKFSGQLANIFEYLDMLAEVNTDGVVETSQVTGLNNVYGKDELLAPLAEKDELLACSELPIDSDQVRVMKTIK